MSRIKSGILKHPAISFCLIIVVALVLEGRIQPVKAQPLSDSTQTSTISVPLETPAEYITTGDINSDLYPDIVVKGRTTAQFYLILNDGAGGFLPPTPSLNVPRSSFLNLRDFNNDGKLDLFFIVAPEILLNGDWSFNVSLGNGAGNFAPPIVTPLSTSVRMGDITFADFNSDNFLDFAVSTFGPGTSLPAGGAHVGLGNGMGAFTVGPYISLRPRGTSIAAADFNQDNKPDLADLGFGGGLCTGCEAGLQILLNDGNGNFPTANSLTQPDFIVANFSSGDVNNDGKADLVGIRGAEILSLLGTGAGDFVAGGSVNPGTFSTFKVRLADFNNDAKLDVAFTGYTTNLAYIIFGNGLGGFPSGITLGTGVTPRYFDIADFNRNGTPDLAIANYESNFLTVIFDPDGSTPPLKTQFDFDGDLRADIAVYREGNTPGAPSYWHILNSGNGTYQAYQMGSNGDKPIPADYDGDGKTEVAVWRPSTGVWYTSTDPAINYGAFHWGQTGDVPIPGDFDGDNKADHVVWRPGNGNWYVFRSSDGGFQQQQFGTSTDKPVLGDFDGDGKADYAFYRPGATQTANSFWNVIQSSNGAFLSAQFGRGEDKPVAADYDGNGITNFAVYRPSTFTWYRSLDPAINYGAVVWGMEGDVPAPGDYDRDGRADVAIFRPGSSIWYVLQTSDGSYFGERWGVPSDRPVESSFLP
jgi:hypothetical protein